MLYTADGNVLFTADQKKKKLQRKNHKAKVLDNVVVTPMVERGGMGT